MIRFLSVLNLILQTHPINTNLPEITTFGEQSHFSPWANTTEDVNQPNRSDWEKSHLCHPWAGKCLSQVFRCSYRFSIRARSPLYLQISSPLGCAASPHSSSLTVGGPPAPPHGRFPLITPGSQRSPQGQRGDMYQPARHAALQE